MTSETVGGGDRKGEAATPTEKIGRLQAPSPDEWPAEVAELASGFAEKVGTTA